MKRKRQQAWRRGRRSEALARLVLRLAGYRILAYGHRTSPGEIDIIARRGAILAFVEVKARADFGQAADALLGGGIRNRGAGADGHAPGRATGQER